MIMGVIFQVFLLIIAAVAAFVLNGRVPEGFLAKATTWDWIWQCSLRGGISIVLIGAIAGFMFLGNSSMFNWAGIDMEKSEKLSKIFSIIAFLLVFTLAVAGIYIFTNGR